ELVEEAVAGRCFQKVAARLTGGEMLFESGGFSGGEPALAIRLQLFPAWMVSDHFGHVGCPLPIRNDVPRPILSRKSRFLTVHGITRAQSLFLSARAWYPTSTTSRVGGCHAILSGSLPHPVCPRPGHLRRWPGAGR